MKTKQRVEEAIQTVQDGTLKEVLDRRILGETSVSYTHLLQAIYNPNEIEEERRLAYVAITRAREELYILNAESRMIFGSTSRNKPSRFIAEIPEELIERSRTREWKKPKPGMVLPTSAYEARVVSTNAARHFGPSSLEQGHAP